MFLAWALSTFLAVFLALLHTLCLLPENGVTVTEQQLQLQQQQPGQRRVSMFWVLCICNSISTGTPPRSPSPCPLCCMCVCVGLILKEIKQKSKPKPPKPNHLDSSGVECSGVVCCGVVWFEVEPSDEAHFNSHINRLGVALDSVTLWRALENRVVCARPLLFLRGLFCLVFFIFFFLGASFLCFTWPLCRHLSRALFHSTRFSQKLFCRALVITVK